MLTLTLISEELHMNLWYDHKCVFISLVTPPIKNIKEVTEPLKKQIIKGDIHTIEEMKAWLKPFGYSDAIKDATINAILREFVMSKVSCDEMHNMDMIVELLRPQKE